MGKSDANRCLAVTDGRYLAINGGSTNRTSDEGVVYRRVIKDVVVGQELNVTMNLFNLLPSNYIGENNPNLVVRLYNPGNRTIYEEKSFRRATAYGRLGE